MIATCSCHPATSILESAKVVLFTSCCQSPFGLNMQTFRTLLTFNFSPAAGVAAADSTQISKALGAGATESITAAELLLLL
jgi:hypothetical protein